MQDTADAADTTEPTTEPAGRSSLPHWRIDATVLGIVALLLRLPAFLTDKSLVFDDGVFAASAYAMRAGEAPFKSVFSSQGPAFLPLLWLGDLLGLRTVNSPRVLSVASGVVVTIAVYAIARHVTTRGRALLAAGLVTTAGTILWVTVPANADGPSLALSVLAVAFALRYRDDPRVINAVWVGLAAGGAVSIKALSVPAVFIAGLIVLLACPAKGAAKLRDAAIAAGTAVVVYLVFALPWGIGRVWEQSFTYHEKARRIATRAGAAEKIWNTLVDRDLLVMVALGLTIVTALVLLVMGRRPNRLQLVVVGMLVLWAFLVFALLLWEPAMWRAHVSHLVVPLALLACLRPPPWPLLAVALLVATPVWIDRNTAILWPSGYSGNDRALVQKLETLPSDALVISDDPGWVWRADRRPPGDFADVSYQRIDNKGITEDSLVRAAKTSDVCGVIVSSPLHFRRFHTLPDRLEANGYERLHFGAKTLYLKRDCRPGS
ncbi:MAG: glycosyltransferase family 39 protein [Acidimicrobiia bacterium]